MSPFRALRQALGVGAARTTVEQVSGLLDGGAVLLDVRENGEWNAGHAPQARHIPLGQLADRAGTLPVGRQVITVCRAGGRSAQAARILSGRGVDAISLSGGMIAWARAGLPVVGRGGRPGTVV